MNRCEENDVDTNISIECNWSIRRVKIDNNVQYRSSTGLSIWILKCSTNSRRNREKKKRIKNVQWKYHQCLYYVIVQGNRFEWWRDRVIRQVEKKKIGDQFWVRKITRSKGCKFIRVEDYNFMSKVRGRSVISLSLSLPLRRWIKQIDVWHVLQTYSSNITGWRKKISNKETNINERNFRRRTIDASAQTLLSLCERIQQ